MAAVATTELDVSTLAAEIERRMAQVIAGNAPEDGAIERVQSGVESFVRREVTLLEREERRSEEQRRLGLRGRGSADVEAIWAGGGSDKPCDDCTDRHGEVETVRTWNVRGLPGSPNLACGRGCKCDLVPVSALDGEDE